MKRVAIITSSDMGYQGKREDLSGPAIKEIAEREGYQVVSMDILPDDRAMLSRRMAEISACKFVQLWENSNDGGNNSYNNKQLSQCKTFFVFFCFFKHFKASYLIFFIFKILKRPGLLSYPGWRF